MRKNKLICEVLPCELLIFEFPLARGLRIIADEKFSPHGVLVMICRYNETSKGVALGNALMFSQLSATSLDGPTATVFALESSIRGSSPIDALWMWNAKGFREILNEGLTNAQLFHGFSW